MKNFMPSALSAITASLIAALVLTQTAAAQDAPVQTAQSTPQAQPPAPVQRQGSDANLEPEALARQRLLSAHTIYLAKSTQDANFPASPDDAYNLVLASLQNWGRFQVVDSVAQADLVLQLRDAVKTSVVDHEPTDPGSTVYYLPSFQITIADPSTLSPIWSVASSVPTSVKRKNQGPLLSAAAINVVSKLKLLTGDTLTAKDQAAQKTLSHYYRSHVGLAIALAAGGTALGLGLFFLFKHNAQQNQAAFCQAHNISPCPGA